MTFNACAFLRHIGMAAAGLMLMTQVGGFSASAQDAPHDAKDVWPYLEKLDAAQRQSVLESEAAKESGVTIYGATGIDRAQFWINEFNKRYPNLKIQFVRLTETDLVQKVLAEAKTDKAQSDMIFETSTYLPLLQKTLAPYKTGQAKDIDPRFIYGGAEQGWTAYAYEIYPESVAWRTDRISGDDVPKTLKGLADSKLAGRVGTTPNIARLATGLVETYGEDGANDLLKKLSTLDNKVYASHAALSDALASGEIDVAWDLVAARPIGLKKKGAPVDWRPMDPLYAESNCVGILQSTRNPYTAALFLDFMLSKEGAEANDKWEQGRIYGNTTGNYTMSLTSYPSLKLFPVVDTGTLKKWQLVGERLFIRRQ